MEHIEHYAYKEKGEEKAAEIEEKLVSFLHEIVEVKDRIIGEGKTAEVAYWSNENKNLCIKLISRERMDSLYEERQAPAYNSPKKEGEFLEKVAKTTTKVKVPEVVGYLSFEDSKNKKVEGLIMSRIQGFSLKEVHENPEILPENFDIEKYFIELEKFLKEMHEHDHVHHRDLSEGNLMISSESGMPAVIDFGDACYDFGYENKNDVYKVSDSVGPNVYIAEEYPKDLVVIKAIRRNLETRLENYTKNKNLTS